MVIHTRTVLLRRMVSQLHWCGMVWGPLSLGLCLVMSNTLEAFRSIYLIFNAYTYVYHRGFDECIYINIYVLNKYFRIMICRFALRLSLYNLYAPLPITVTTNWGVHPNFKILSHSIHVWHIYLHLVDLYGTTFGLVNTPYMHPMGVFQGTL